MRIQPHEALQRLSKRGVVGKAKGVKSSTPVEFVRGFGHNENLPTLYLFRKGVQGIITPADDFIRPILADCETADWTVELPPSLIDLLGEYDRQITLYQNSGIDIGMREDDMLGDTDRLTIQPLLKTVWAQGSPFNRQLVFEGNECIVGCVALSMAQILYYWGVTGKDGKKYRRGCMATEAYTTTTNKYKVDALPPIAKFDYDHLTQKAPASAASIKAVAEIVKYCGCSIQSNYTPSLTLASNSKAKDALRTHLRMGNPSMIWASSGEAKFEQKIYNELANGRPVMIAGYRAGGGGHMFNCDGYNDLTDLFHINLGWGGPGNGWYAMTAIKPKPDREYTINLSAIIGIEPTYMLGDANGDGKVDISDVTKIVNDALNGNNRQESDINFDGKVDVSDLTLLQNKLLGK